MLFGLLLIYVIGKYYHDLFRKYKGAENKSWPFVLLGISIYYAGALSFGLLAAVLGDRLFDIDLDDINEIVLSLISMPFGILGTLAVYKYLKRKWKKEYVDPSLEIETIGSEVVDEEQPLIQ